MSRIIAGSRGGRRLVVPAGAATRPTTDRVREAVFSAIAAWAGTAAEPPAEALQGRSFADLYAGSGAAGLEAASRGAAPVVLVEADRRAAAAIARNLADLGLAAQLRRERVEQVLSSRPAAPFDVVFADPPYEVGTDRVNQLLARLHQAGWAGPDSLIVVERARRSEPPRWPVGFEGGWARHYGDTTVYFGCAG